MWTLYHLGWMLLDAWRFANYPTLWTLVPLALALVWLVARLAHTRSHRVARRWR